MFRKYLSLFIGGLIFYGVDRKVIFALPDAESSAESSTTEKIKANVFRLETSGKTKIVVKLKSGAKLKGYITKTEEESFDLTNYQTRQTVAVPYRDVAQVKSQNGSSKSMKTALTVAGVAGVVVLTLPREDSAICPLGCRSF